MKQYFWILLLLLFVLFSVFSKRNVKEGFSPSYQNCIDQGYSKEFCVQTPVSAYGPSTCLCDDGRLGRIIPGFGGECIC
jgi:hypothetical protein